MSFDLPTLYVQRRTHRAGAQTALARIVRGSRVANARPTVLYSDAGWLVQECARSAIPTVQVPFPSSRSLPARLYGNAIFARRAARALERRSIAPTIVHANDHLEGILSYRLARAVSARSAIFLRSSAMTRSDFFKYQCDKYELIFAVGRQLYERARTWLRDRPIELIHDGLAEDDFSPVKPHSAERPAQILVIGSAQELKGWRDFFAALRILVRGGGLPSVTFDLTGAQPRLDGEDAELKRLVAERCRFLGRVESFKDLVRSYELVINPSRMESFGMAAMETLAAGVPLLSSRTGAIEDVQEQAHMLFSPSNPASLAEAMQYLFAHWPQVDFGVAQAQANIRGRFMIGRTVTQLLSAYERLVKSNAATGSA